MKGKLEKWIFLKKKECVNVFYLYLKIFRFDIGQKNIKHKKLFKVKIASIKSIKITLPESHDLQLLE